MEFKKRLRELRERRGMTQKELAERLHISTAAMNMFETGKRTPSRETLENIADYFNVDIDYLIGREFGSTYYLAPEAAEIAKEIFDRPELKTLFKAVKDMPAEDIIKAKKQNAANLINRLQPDIDIKYSIAHSKGKGLIGTIDKKWADKLNNGENVTTFVFWGRADDQKGANNVLEAFARFAKTPEGKNSIIIAGGELEHQSSENIILRKLDEMGKDEELKGN